MNAWERGAFAFAAGFVAALAIVAALALAGCTAAQREGHRAAFKVDRLALDGDDSASSLAVNGPGPHDGDLSTSSGGGDMDGWGLGVEYSIPLGDDPAASQLRLLRTDVGGLRADQEDLQASLERLSAAMDGLAVELRKPPPAQPTEPERIEPAHTPAHETAADADQPDGLSAVESTGIGTAAAGVVLLIVKYHPLILGLLARAWPWKKSDE